MHDRCMEMQQLEDVTVHKAGGEVFMPIAPVVSSVALASQNYY